MNSRMRIKRGVGQFFLLLCASFLVAYGCGGGGSGTSDGASVSQGTFEDSIVEGLEYQTASQSGFTDSNGIFEFQDGETVTFSIGDIILGQAPAESWMTPIDLVNGAVDPTDPTVSNICRFLMTLDDDGNPDNGILINESVREDARGRSVDFNLSITDFENDPDVLQAVDSLTALTSAGQRDLCSCGEAQIHLGNLYPSVNPDNIIVPEGGTGTATITGGSGPFSASSNNPSVATVSVDGRSVTVTGVAKGTVTATITDSHNSSVTSEVVVCHDDLICGPDLTQIDSLIQRFAPILYFGKSEKYWMDDPEYFLDNGVDMALALEPTYELKEDDPEQNFFPKHDMRHFFWVSAAKIKDQTNAAYDFWYENFAPSVPYWVEGRYHLFHRGIKEGDLNRAKALVRVLPYKNDPELIEIQFWLFFPYNGPGRVEVCAAFGCNDIWMSEAGRHYGDWERVSILVNWVTEELYAVNTSIHGHSATFLCDLVKPVCYCCLKSVGNMRKESLVLGGGTHPHIYVGIYSHALYQYPSGHINYKDGPVDQVPGVYVARLFDRTYADVPFEISPPAGPPRYRILSSEVPNAPVTEPDWVSWGTEKWGYSETCVECPPFHEDLCSWMDEVGKPRCGYPVLTGGRWGQPEFDLCDGIIYGGIKWYTYCDDGNGPTGPVMKPDWEGVFHDLVLVLGKGL